MSVGAAVRVLSRSVSLAIEELIDLNLMIPEACPTSKLCLLMNNLWDIFNSSSSSLSKNEFYGEPLRIGSDSWKFLNQCKRFISEIRVFHKFDGTKDKTANFKCLKGLIQAINGHQGLLEMLQEEYGYQHYEFIYARRLQQDCIEGTYGIIRATTNGYCANPTPLKFSTSFRKVNISNGSHFVSDKTNCEAVMSVQLITLDEIQQLTCEADQNSTVVPFLKIKSKISTVVSFKSTDLKDPVELKVLMHMAGFLVYKIDRRHRGRRCNQCDYSVSRNEASELHSFTSRKEFKNLTTFNQRGLRFASPEFFDYIKSCEVVFNDVFCARFHELGIVSTITEALKSSCTFDFCSDDIEHYCLRTFTRVRILYKLKFFNRDYEKNQTADKKRRRELKDKKRDNK